MRSAPTFTIQPSGPFSLREAALFGFGQRHLRGFDGVLRFAFSLDGGRGQAGVALRQHADGEVFGTMTDSAGEAPVDAVRHQVARVLSLDLDGRGYLAVGDRDPVVARLLEAAPGLRPPLFYSPYEAAVWAVLSNHRSRASADAVRSRLSAALSPCFDVAGTPMHPLPLPGVLAAADELPGVDPVRADRVRRHRCGRMGGAGWPRPGWPPSTSTRPGPSSARCPASGRSRPT